CDGDFAHVKELDFGYRPAVELVQDLSRIRPLDLIPVESANNRDIPGNGPLVSREGNFVSAGLGMILNPVVNGGPADEKQLILVEIKEDAVANHVSVVIAPDKLLGLIDTV